MNGPLLMTATHYNILQHICNSGATHCNTLQHTATHCNTLQHTSSTLQHTATYCNTLRHSATLCNTLQHPATLCNTLYILQPTATHRNTFCACLKISKTSSIVVNSVHLVASRLWTNNSFQPRVCCSVLQCVAVCCSVLKCVEKYLTTINVSIHFRLESDIENIELPAKLLDYFLRSNKSNINQWLCIQLKAHVATYCNTLQHTTTHCKMLQHTTA